MQVKPQSEVLQVKAKDKLKLAMDDEMESLMKNQILNSVELPEDKKVCLTNEFIG